MKKKLIIFTLIAITAPTMYGMQKEIRTRKKDMGCCRFIIKLVSTCCNGIEEGLKNGYKKHQSKKKIKTN